MTPFALTARACFALWRVVDGVVPARRLRAILAGRGIVQAPSQQAITRVNAVEGGHPCVVIATKPIFGPDVDVSIQRR